MINEMARSFLLQMAANNGVAALVDSKMAYALPAVYITKYV